MDRAMFYFVWVRHWSGLKPEIWSEDVFRTTAARDYPAIVRIPLSKAERALSIDELARRFPAPPPE